MQTADSERKTTQSRSTQYTPHTTTVPALLTKAFLCDYYGIPHCGWGKRRLRSQVLTDAVLHDADIPLDGYRNIRSFTAVQSRRLREILGL